MQWFPFPHAREKQVKALDFIERAVGRGYRDIVVAAPTGIGKTGIGVTTALWGDAESLSSLEGESGGYYLVTQKMLQDQLTQDFNKFIARFRAQSSSLKSSSEYTCQARGNCMAGGRAKPACHARKNGGCPYRMAYDAFVSNPVALTNYAYFMTEKAHIGKFAPRRFMVLDECHTVERQLLSFVDVSVGNTEMGEWAPHIGKVPDLPSADDFCDWLESVYIACIKERMELKLVQAQDSSDPRLHQQVQQLQNHYSRLRTAVHSMRSDPTNWVYWQELEEDGISLRSVAKPIEAAPFTHDLLTSSGSVRVYMSAYPGEKKVFCRSLGLDPSTVAWCNLGSTFPVENRPVHLYYCGSMSRNNVGATLPNMLRMTGGIMRQHATEKGVIHCHTYKLGLAITDHFRGTPEGERLLFPKKANDRKHLLQHHLTSSEPTVLISPSMTEGFSLDDEAARWQIIAKVAYPYLGDRQIRAKEQRDPEWYAMQAAMTAIQAAGRIVRSDTDWGATYILDSDFEGLINRHPEFFPLWFTSAFVRH